MAYAKYSTKIRNDCTYNFHRFLYSKLKLCHQFYRLMLNFSIEYMCYIYVPLHASWLGLHSFNAIQYKKEASNKFHFYL